MWALGRGQAKNVGVVLFVIITVVNVMKTALHTLMKGLMEV